MLTDEQCEFIRKAALTMQIIVAVMAGGVVAFLVIALVVRGGRAGEMGPASYVALAYIALSLIGWAVVPNVILRRGLRSLAAGKPPFGAAQAAMPAEVGDAGHLVQLYTTRLIVASAIVEGVAFFDIIAYLVEGSPWTLVAATVLFLIIAFQVPTRTRVEDWVVRQMETIEQMRSTPQQ